MFGKILLNEILVMSLIIGIGIGIGYPEHKTAILPKGAIQPAGFMLAGPLSAKSMMAAPVESKSSIVTAPLATWWQKFIAWVNSIIQSLKSQIKCQ